MEKLLFRRLAYYAAGSACEWGCCARTRPTALHCSVALCSLVVESCWVCQSVMYSTVQLYSGDRKLRTAKPQTAKRYVQKELARVIAGLVVLLYTVCCR